MHEDHEDKGARYSAFFSALLDDRFHETGSRGTPAFKRLPVSIEGRGEQNSVKSVGGTGVGYVAGSIAIEHCQRSRRADRCSSTGGLSLLGRASSASRPTEAIGEIESCRYASNGRDGLDSTFYFDGGHLAGNP
jgi:hypothetical protein